MKRARQQGQAMIEAVVVFGIIVMLFLGIFYLGKFHDVQASTIQAARYAAWERTVHSTAAMPDVRVQNQARARLFTWNRDGFKASDGLADGSNWTAQTAVWYDHSTQQRLIERPNDVKITTALGAFPGRAAGSMAEALGKLGGLLDDLTGGEALPQGGLASGSVEVKLDNLARLPAPLNELNLTLRERSAVAVDAWDASGPRQAALRSRTFTLAGPFTKISGVLAPIEFVLSKIEPAFSDLELGQVCPDIVPSDRVESARVLPAYQGGGACVR